jgi:hypothetical protein
MVLFFEFTMKRLQNLINFGTIKKKSMFENDWSN